LRTPLAKLMVPAHAPGLVQSPGCTSRCYQSRGHQPIAAPLALPPVRVGTDQPFLGPPVSDPSWPQHPVYGRGAHLGDVRDPSSAAGQWRLPLVRWTHSPSGESSPDAHRGAQQWPLAFSPRPSDAGCGPGGIRLHHRIAAIYPEPALGRFIRQSDDSQSDPRGAWGRPSRAILSLISRR